MGMVFRFIGRFVCNAWLDTKHGWDTTKAMRKQADVEVHNQKYSEPVSEPTVEDNIGFTS